MSRMNFAERKKLRDMRKVGVIRHYSNGTMKCSFCGIDDIRVLSIDHVNGKGAAHRKKIKRSSGSAFYHWLVVNGYPLGYQVLCMNCQWIKRFNRNENMSVRKVPSQLTLG